MSETIKISIPGGEWTRINSGPLGTVSNFGERDIHLRESRIRPSDSTIGGFVLRPSANEPFALAESFNLFARPKKADSTALSNTNVFVTNGIGKIIDNKSIFTILGLILDENKNIVKQLKLLNLRTEEMGNTGVDIDATEGEQDEN